MWTQHSTQTAAEPDTIRWNPKSILILTLSLSVLIVLCVPGTSLNVNAANSLLIPFKAVGIDSCMLVTSDIGIRDNSGNAVQAPQVSSFPYANFAWDTLKDMGVNLINVGGGQEGNWLHICDSYNHPWGQSYDTYWAENLNAFLNKAHSYGMQVVFHLMGDHWGTLGGIVAPMEDRQVINPYTSVSEALTVLSRMGDPTQNDMHMNFLNDSRVAFWQPINEANVVTYKSWIRSVLQGIRSYGGKTSVCVTAGSAYWQSFPDVIVNIGDLVDYLQVHDFGEAAVEQVSSQGSDMYTTAYNLFNQHFQYMVATKGSFSATQIFDMEVCCPVGANVHDVAGNPVTISGDQQTQFIRALFDAAKANGIGGVDYWQPIDQKSSPEIGDFIDFYGNMRN